MWNRNRMVFSAVWCLLSDCQGSSSVFPALQMDTMVLMRFFFRTWSDNVWFPCGTQSLCLTSSLGRENFSPMQSSFSVAFIKKKDGNVIVFSPFYSFLKCPRLIYLELDIQRKVNMLKSLFTQSRNNFIIILQLADSRSLNTTVEKGDSEGWRYVTGGGLSLMKLCRTWSNLEKEFWRLSIVSPILYS